MKNNTKKKVLAVDDSPDILDVIKDMLSQYPYEVYTADNGAQALDKYTRFKPDVVTLDITMPVMNGYETLSKLLELNGNAKIIMLTALENQELLARCLSRGASGYLVKPFSEEELVIAITQVFSIDYNKYINAFFSHVNNALDNSIKKLVHPLASVTLNDTKLLYKPTSHQTFSSTSDLSQIKSVPVMVQELKLNAPDGTVGYISKFNGQQQGMIVSFIGKKDLGFLVECSHVKKNNCSQDLEFFNIINMKVLSHLANSKNIRLYPEQVSVYDENEDKFAPANDVAKAKFEVDIGGRVIPLEIQLWFNLQ